MPYNKKYQSLLWGGQAQLDPTPKEAPFILFPAFRRVNRRERRAKLANDETPYLLNGRINRGVLQPRPGLVLTTAVRVLGITFDAAIVGVFEFKLSGGARYTIITTIKSLYQSSDQLTFTRVPWTYTTGTVEVAIGDLTKVLGTTTAWLTNAHAGDKITIGANTRVIASVDSDDDITVTVAFPGAVAPGAAYSIDRYFSGAVTDLFWGLTIADTDQFVFCQGVDPVLVIDSDVNLITRLSTNCPAAEFGVLYADRLLIAKIPSYPYRMQYCVAADYDNWTGEGSGNNDFVDDPGVLTGLSVIGNRGVLYKEDNIYIFERTGLAASPFYYAPAIKGIGNYIPGSLKSLGSYNIFCGMDNFYTFDGQTQPVPIGNEIKDDFFSSLNIAYKYIAHSQLAKRFDEYQLFYCSTGSTTPNRVIVYNYVDKVWMPDWDMASNCSGSALRLSGDTWDAAVGTWATDTDIWDISQEVESTPIIFIGYGTGLYEEDENVDSDAGTTFTFQVETKDIVVDILKEYTMFKVILSYYIEGTTAMYISSSTDGGASWGSEVMKILSSDDPSSFRRTFWDFVKTSETLSLRFRSVGGKFKMVEIRIEGIASGNVIP